MTQIRIGRTAKPIYIERIQNNLKQEDVLLTAIGNRIRTLVSIVYEFGQTEKIWNIRKTNEGAFELQVLLKQKK